MMRGEVKSSKKKGNTELVALLSGDGIISNDGTRIKLSSLGFLRFFDGKVTYHVSESWPVGLSGTTKTFRLIAEEI